MIIDNNQPLLIDIREQTVDYIPKRTYATHGFDKYPAKMIPHIARWIIEKYTKPGNIILDPFCGCGTVLIESRITGRHATGIDANPLAIILTGAKTGLYNGNILTKRIKSIICQAKRFRKSHIQYDGWVKYWFSETALLKLGRLSTAIEIDSKKYRDKYCYALKAILAVTTRLSSKADPRSPKPFISKKARRERAGKEFDPYDIFEKQGKIFFACSAEFRELVKDGNKARVRHILYDSKEMNNISNIGKFDHIITSPPYLSAQDYYRSSKLEIAILNLFKGPKPSSIGDMIIGSGRGHIPLIPVTEFTNLPREVELIFRKDARAANLVMKYLYDMELILRQCYNHLKKNGKCSYVVGNCTIRGIELPIHTWVICIAKKIGLKLVDHYIDIVKNRRVPPKRCGHESIIGKEHILVMSK